jgi:hypothetical protein
MLPDPIAAKRELYLAEIKPHQDRAPGSGFVLWQGGDSLFYSCLARIGGVTGIRLRDARNHKGVWYRRPTRLPECYEHDLSGSTISRDPIVTLLLCALLDGEAGAAIWLDILQDFYDYCIDHTVIPYALWQIGRGDPARIYLTPGLMSTLVRVIDRLGGDLDSEMKRHRDLWRDKFTMLEFPAGIEGSGRHLQVLHIMTRGLCGKLSGTEKDCLREHAGNEPRNAIFNIAAEKFAKLNDGYLRALKTLDDTSLFPAKRLPRVSDRKHQYLWLRGVDSGDWKPGTKKTEHPGVDYLFATALLEGLA